MLTPELEKDLLEFLKGIALDTQKQVKAKLASNGNVASGKLKNSIVIGVVYDKPNDRFSMGLSMLKYGKFIQYGRKPTTSTSGPGAVQKAIRKWIDDKGIQPRPGKNGKTPTKDQLAYLIARQIHEKGFISRYAPKSFIDPFEMIKKQLPEFLERYGEDVAIYFAKIWKDMK
jgi:hypothetical protein